jgi:hypothetical protein
MLEAALEATARARGAQLWIAGRPSEYLGLPAVDKAGVMQGTCAALERARDAGWELSSFGRPEVRAWSTARHPQLTGDRYIDLVFPELERDERDMPPALRQLPADQLHLALVELAQLVGYRLAITPGYTFEYIAKTVNKGRTLAVTALPAPVLDRDSWALHEAPRWERQPTEEEWARRYAWGFDRSGSYLGALAGFHVGVGDLVELGAGAARARLEPDQVRGRLSPDQVGYWHVAMTGPDPMAARGLPPILDRPEGWVTDPTLSLLVERRAPFEVGRALVWTEHLRYYGAIQALLARIRAQLVDRRDPVGAAVLDVVKAMYTGGPGRLRYEREGPRHPLYRPDVYHALWSRARANLQRSLWKAQRAPVAYFGKDTVLWFSDAETAAEAAAEAAIPYSRELGSWHQKDYEALVAEGRQKRDGRRRRGRPTPPIAGIFAALIRRPTDGA